ncbi:hypothetical protein MKS88_000631 [Plasmodium brasilianum]|uniref:Uncharacterized protein n=1 Tax=Plasmodium brasilianum TaxID=5824 RepID=A0ACB9YEF1_PLABR|nr:hypothetical protein MKS88_000631 [Plasmodium brasilianum]
MEYNKQAMDGSDVISEYGVDKGQEDMKILSAEFEVIQSTTEAEYMKEDISEELTPNLYETENKGDCSENCIYFICCEHCQIRKIFRHNKNNIYISSINECNTTGKSNAYIPVIVMNCIKILTSNVSFILVVPMIDKKTPKIILNIMTISPINSYLK